MLRGSWCGTPKAAQFLGLPHVSHQNGSSGSHSFDSFLQTFECSRSPPPRWDLTSWKRGWIFDTRSPETSKPQRIAAFWAPVELRVLQTPQNLQSVIDRRDFWAYKSVEILVFASPTGYTMLTSSGSPLLKLEEYSLDSSKTISNFPAVLMNFNRFFLHLKRFIWD